MADSSRTVRRAKCRHGSRSRNARAVHTHAVPDFDDVLERYVATRRSTGAPEWSGPADENEIAGLRAAVEPLVVPDQLIALWRHVAEGWGWLVDAGDLVSPHVALEMWQEHGSVDWPPFPPTLLPIAFASHVYLTIELGYPGRTAGGALLRVPFEQIEPVSPDLATALDLVASAMSEAQVRWNGTWWDGADIEELQRSRAIGYAWPAHLTRIGTVAANLPLTWPPVWQLAAGIDPADAEPRGATASLAGLESTSAGVSVRVSARVLGLVGSGAGSLVTFGDDTATIRCWCPATRTRSSRCARAMSSRLTSKFRTPTRVIDPVTRARRSMTHRTASSFATGIRPGVAEPPRSSSRG